MGGLPPPCSGQCASLELKKPVAVASMGRQLYAMLRPKVPLEHFRRRRMAFRLLPPFVDELPHQRFHGDAPGSRLLLEPALVLRIQASHSDCGGHRTPKGSQAANATVGRLCCQRKDCESRTTGLPHRSLGEKTPAEFARMVAVAA